MDDSDRGRFSLSLVVAFSFSLETASKRDDSDGVDFEDVIFEFVVGAKEKNIDL
jgi:hypothetical protein